MTRKTTPKAMNFEQSLKQLKTLADALEKEEISLEDSVKTFEQGMKLARECQQTLKTAEQKILLLSKEDNEWVEKDPNHDDVESE